MQPGSSTLSPGVSPRNTLLGDLLKRQIRFVVGLAMLAGLAFAIAALATWNVSDPSFSNANGAVPHNALGFSGAAFADLVMQFFGLAGVIGLLPALFWAICLMRTQPVDRMGRRGAAWFGGAWLTAALFGLMPASQSWPLPNGLGGVLGDMALKIPAVFTGGFPSGLVAVILGVLLAPAAGWLLLYGAGLTGRAPAAAATATDADLAETEEDEDASSGSLMLGALTHSWFTLRGRIRRLAGLASSARRRVMPEAPLDFNTGYDDGDDFGVEPVFAEPRPARRDRVEPGFGPATPRRPVAVDDAPPFDLDDEDDHLPEGVLSADLDEDDPASDWRPQPAPARASAQERPAGASPRISAPAERPKPGA
ncbi:DNA translocase FtsK 4TM domain-containing protein, partial [Hoeflea sp. BAL378]|uniref:DNA translocase FtsK 4TM domain-containing protein n=1 Tax=Hoeflea sp. BAL378 TaxID=1547437 RepID=UPI001FCA69BB